MKKIIFLGTFIFAFTLVSHFVTADYYLGSGSFWDLAPRLLLHVYLVSAIWIIGLFICLGFFWEIENKIRYIFPSLWFLLFFGNVFVWTLNIVAIKYSGAEITPFMFTHIERSNEMASALLKDVHYLPLILLISSGILLICILVLVLRSKTPTPKKALIFTTIVFIITLSLVPFRSTLKQLPEYFIARSFYINLASRDPIELSPTVFEKLEKFGLHYYPFRPQVAHQNQVFQASQNLLPAKFAEQKPNVIIVFLESFSNDLTSLYNSEFPELTPRLEEIAAHPNVTIFNNFYNAATPTITAIITKLCSFLPPTGHDEISQEGKFVEHKLLCLPEILQTQGYKSASYLTAIEKEFAHKDRLLTNMAVSNIIGQEELAQEMLEPTLAWGYSDHQLYPALQSHLEQVTAPFLFMMTSIDTHQPYNMARDIIPYGRGSKDLLNSVHTADDAFGKFWDYFLNSEFSENTILIAIADHAAFPIAYDKIKEYFPDSPPRTFYDDQLFMIYIPDSVLPKEIDLYSSGLDFTPTLLHILDINVPNSFEGHSIFDDRDQYPHLLGFNEFQLYLNELDETGQRQIRAKAPAHILCEAEPENATTLTECEYLQYYHWKKQTFSEGRFWETENRFTAQPVEFQPTLIPPRLIAHGGGSYEDLTYTNSWQALDANYEKGFRLFEIDLSWTADNQLALIHDWEKTYERYFSGGYLRPWNFWSRTF